MSKTFKVALIGRANTGKSTLFNRLTDQRKAIVSDIPGTTRDRNYSTCHWRGLGFTLIDTGGVDLVHDAAFEKDVIKQARFALGEADLILFVVDVKDGLMPQDNQVAKLLRQAHKPIILVINKADNLKLRNQIAEFYRLGLGEPQVISAANGSGTGDLLDEVFNQLKPTKNRTKTIKDDSEKIKITILGKPNVGKSTLVNSILGEERVITSPVPYTTRDAQDIELKYLKKTFVLIDTAGVRKNVKIGDRLERFSVDQSLASIGKADIVFLMTDASKPLGHQDNFLSDAVLRAHKSVVLIANKWDVIPDKDTKTINKFMEYYQHFFPYLDFAPLIFISALEKKNVNKLLDLALEIYQERFRQITDNALDKFLKDILRRQPPARGKGVNQPRIYELKQLDVNPPTFEVVKDFSSDIHHSYLRFIENRLRAKFGFDGTPIVIKVRRVSA